MASNTEWCEQILRKSGIEFVQSFVIPTTGHIVYWTIGLQIVGAYRTLENYRRRKNGYVSTADTRKLRLQETWQAHHIVEKQDLRWLRAIGRPIPGDEFCPSVLLPPGQHARFNSMLHSGEGATTVADIDDYRDVYTESDNYTGGGRRVIGRELIKICQAIFKA